jgi:hypothetical protein
MKTFSSQFLLLLAAIRILSGCNNDSSHINPPVVVNRPAFYVIDQPGRIVINAKCLPGEQMIGGGYRFPTFEVNTIHFRKESERTPQEIFDGTNAFNDDATPCDKQQAPLIIEASYPSAKDTWTVIIFNPDPQENCYNSGKMIQVDCYAVSNPAIHLFMKIRSTVPHSVNLTNAPQILTDTCNCTTGGIVTAGGFKLEPGDDNLWRGSAGDSPLWGSYPNTNSSHQAIGWAADYNSKSNYQANLTTYVLCSTQGSLYKPQVWAAGGSVSNWLLPNALVDGPVKKEEFKNTIGAGYRSGQVACEAGYFSPGGGFRMVYAGKEAPFLAIPHGPINQNTADAIINGQLKMFAGWSWEGFGAYQAAYYNWATSENDSVYAIQIKDLLPNLEVQITNPAKNSYVGEDPANKGFSIPIQFMGIAHDHDSSAIPDNKLLWEIQGGSSGTGSTFATALNLNGGEALPYASAVRFLVKLTATGKDGDKATASIYVYYMAPIL